MILLTTGAIVKPRIAREHTSPFVTRDWEVDQGYPAHCPDTTARDWPWAREVPHEERARGRFRGQVVVCQSGGRSRAPTCSLLRRPVYGSWPERPASPAMGGRSRLVRTRTYAAALPWTSVPGAPARRDSADARLFPGFPGMNRLRNRLG